MSSSVTSLLPVYSEKRKPFNVIAVGHYYGVDKATYRCTHYSHQGDSFDEAERISDFHCKLTMTTISYGTTFSPVCTKEHVSEVYTSGRREGMDVYILPLPK